MSHSQDDLFASAGSRTADTGWTTAHCDGGARGNPGPAGYGAVVHGPDGARLAELSEFLGVASNNVAEYSGLVAVLRWAVEHGVRQLRVISDSKLMVEQINGRWAVKSPDLRPLWQTARERIGKLERFEITHALRHKNKDADRLANEAMDRGTGRPAAGRPAASKPAVPASSASAPPQPASRAVASGSVRRGFVRNGRVELLGTEPLPDGIFVKIIAE